MFLVASGVFDKQHRVQNNRPFPNCLEPRYQSEARGTTLFKNENDFYLHVSGNSFSYERLFSRPRFHKEAKSNSELAY